MYTYKGKKRRDSRHWWRRIQSRKYRPLITKKSIQVVIVTAGIYLLAHMSSGRKGLYLFAWSLIVCTILAPFKKILRGKKSKKPVQGQKVWINVAEPREVKESSELTDKSSTYRIEEIPSKSSNTESQKTSEI